jgi:hypothetical protein
MKRKSNYLGAAILLCFSIFIFCSCGISDQYGLKRLEGKWQANVQGTDWVETWTKSDEAGILLTGSGKEMQYGGEKPIEDMTISMKNNVLTYTVRSSSQKDELPVDFVLNAETKTSLRFENASHDFPQYISYEFADTDHIIAKIGKFGSEGTDKEFVFDFHRIK